MPNYAAAMDAKTEAEAIAWLDDAVAQHLIEHPDADPEVTRNGYRSGAAYYSGYYGIDTQKRVERLFKACHPIFGSLAEPDEGLTAMEALKAGAAMGKGAIGGLMKMVKGGPLSASLEKKMRKKAKQQKRNR